ncbi:methanogenesis marker 17 protein [Methanoplanus sp. FWC-SCC4]|uniref:Methanogenesis marker 17 protein n=1 Tax=Methanochimaera problematica TaxID=2609417 RepID=A0AA97I3X1_9EURY|nr:methanogenesis marker 17 protein [Methanoplanus sp. FWC-SCC4]WOF15706.1 methanogenesis marker 17 protein [Methanoplanus sp. FWC-SCC4]
MAIGYFEVECREEMGRLAYIDIASDVLKDLDLIKIIDKLHIYIDLDFPFFLAVGKTTKLPSPVHINDFSSVIEDEGKIVINIANETYLARMLTILWKKYSREEIVQPDRFTVTISSSIASVPEIENIEVYDPSEAMYKDLIYAMQWIAPEGFRVRREWVDKGYFWYIASENTLPEDVMEKYVRKYFDKIGGL